MLTFKFNIKDIAFEDSWENPEFGIKTLYFVAPKEYVLKEYPDAVQTAIRLEIPINSNDACDATLEMSPTREDKYCRLTDYDWFDITLKEREIEDLLSLVEESEDDIS